MLVDNNKPPYARFLSSILFKNTITATNDPVLKNLWLIAFPEHQRKSLKDVILGCLGNPIKEVRKGSAQAVASIARIEMPKKMWPNLLPILSSAALHPQVEFRLTALETLDYITEDMEQSLLSKDEVDSILKVIITNINTCENIDVKEKAIICLLNTIRFCGTNFNSPSDAQTIMGAIFKCAECNENIDIKKKGLQTIVEVISVFYETIK